MPGKQGQGGSASPLDRAAAAPASFHSRHAAYVGPRLAPAPCAAPHQQQQQQLQELAGPADTTGDQSASVTAYLMCSGFVHHRKGNLEVLPARKFVAKLEPVSELLAIESDDLGLHAGACLSACTLILLGTWQTQSANDKDFRLS